MPSCSFSIRFLLLELGLLVLLGLGPHPVAGQVDEIDDLLRGGVTDARLLIDSYLSPGITGFEAGLNTGWAGAPQAHRQLGFYVHLLATLTRVPEDDRTFVLRPTDLERFTIENTSLPASPTIAGEEDVPTYRFRLPSGETITMPEGSGVSYVPLPLIVAGVGVGRGTDVMLRLVPSTDIEDYGRLNLYGFGLKHELNPWIFRGTSPVALSVLFQYTRFNLDVVLDEEDDQDLEWETNTWAFNVLVGKRLSILTAYGGLGVETSGSTISLLGTYEVEDDEGNAEPVEDPIDVDFGHDATVRVLAGLRLRASVATLFVEGTVARYPSLTAGLGVDVK